MFNLRSLFRSRRRPPVLGPEQQPPLTYPAVIDNLQSAVRELASIGLDPRTVRNLFLALIEKEAFSRDGWDSVDRAEFLDFAHQTLDLALATEG
jgi:hypothetical protein